jgi:hypothetical protein
MEKRGQITVFIIIGIIFLFLIAGLYYYFSNKSDIELISQIPEPNNEFRPLYEYTQKCIEEATISSAFYIGEHGGYEEIPTPFVRYKGIPIAKVYQYNEGNLLIGLPEVEENYAAVAEKKILSCVADFKAFKDMGQTIEYDPPQVTVKIEKEYILVNPKFKIRSTISTNATSAFYEFPQVKIPLRLGRYYEVANYLVNEAVKEPNYLRASYLGDLYRTESVEFHVPAVSEESAYVYFLIDARENADYKWLMSKYNNNQKFAFIFSMKFT